MSDADPVSWLLIEPGWRVAGSDGEELGRVEEVIGDSSHDVWNGLAVSRGMLGRPRYVAAEQVSRITDGEVRLALSPEQFEALGEWKEPPTTAEVEPGVASPVERAESWVETPTRDRPERLPLLRRILLWLGLKRD